MISSRETKGGSCAVWNSSFLFDLPTGEISQLRVMLEFVIMQVKKLWGPSRSESISTCSYIVLTLWVFFLCYRVRPFPKAKFWVASGLVQRLQMLDELTGGMCATCRWSRRAGTLCSQSLCRAVTKTSQTDSWQWPYLKANVLSINANKNGDYQINFVANCATFQSSSCNCLPKIWRILILMNLSLLV